MYYRNKDYENRAIQSEINQVLDTYFNEEKYGRFNYKKILQSQNLNRNFESTYITNTDIYTRKEVETLESLLKSNNIKAFFTSLSRIIDDLVSELEISKNIKEKNQSYLCNKCNSIKRFKIDQNPNEKIAVIVNKKSDITNRINNLYFDKFITFSIYSNLIKLIGVINRESNLCDDIYKVIGNNLIHYSDVDLNKKVKYLKEDGKEMINILNKVYTEIKAI